MQVSHPALLITLVLSVLAVTASAADIYGYVDSEGISHFSNVPDSSRYQLVLHNANDLKSKPNDRYLPRSQRLDNKAEPSPYAETIVREARANRLDPLLVDAVISVESNHNPNARSSAGAAGLMQLMPDTAKRYGVADPYRAESNIRGGTRYLRDLMAMFNGDINLVLAAYNAGENSVIRYGNTIPPYAETRDYVPKVMRRYSTLRSSILPDEPFLDMAE